MTITSPPSCAAEADRIVREFDTAAERLMADLRAAIDAAKRAEAACYGADKEEGR